MAQVAQQLSQDEHPIDYDRRRQALTDWALPVEDWSTMLAELPMLRRLRAKVDPEPGTVFTWSEVTSSEHLHHPMVQASRHREKDLKSWESLAKEAGKFYQTHLPTGGWRRLRRRLDMYAVELAQACDLGKSLQVDVNSLVAQESYIEHR